MVYSSLLLLTIIGIMHQGTEPFKSLFKDSSIKSSEFGILFTRCKQTKPGIGLTSYHGGLIPCNNRHVWTSTVVLVSLQQACQVLKIICVHNLPVIFLL